MAFVYSPAKNALYGKFWVIVWSHKHARKQHRTVVLASLKLNHLTSDKGVGEGVGISFVSSGK